jgi:hypothetical protein
VEGISNLTFEDIYLAKNNGLKIKLLATADIEHGIYFVCPAFVSDELTNIDEAFNAIKIEYEYAKSQFYTGRGAGKEATGSAVWGDLNISQNINPVSYKPVSVSNTSDFTAYWFLRLNTHTHTDVLYSKGIEIISYNKIQVYYVVEAYLSALRTLKERFPAVQIIQIQNDNILKTLAKQSSAYSFQF